MGTGQSNTSSVVTMAPATSSSQLLTKPAFRVKVTRDGKELNAGQTPVEKAYFQGREEGFEAVHKSLDAVAAQVYDNIHEQLLDMQKQNLAKSEQMVVSIRSKLTPPPTAVKSCSSEEGVLAACLKSNMKSPLACSEMVNTYHECAVKSLT